MIDRSIFHCIVSIVSLWQGDTSMIHRPLDRIDAVLLCAFFTVMSGSMALVVGSGLWIAGVI